MHYLPDPASARAMSTNELRAHFLVRELFQPGAATYRHIDLDRVVLGGVVPMQRPLRLEAPASIASTYFAERREIGVLNIGGAGTVSVDGTVHRVGHRDVLYVGRGSREVSFASDHVGSPASFYLVSYPAHVTCPTTLVRHDEAQASELGDSEHANRRILRRYIHADSAGSAQLVMGVTELQPGSVWNSMPPHTHHRRTEVYLYFGVPADGAVFHVLGEPQETRHLLVHDAEVVLAPGWSIHAGCGTSHYAFCWAMGGENQEFADMQAAPVSTLL